MENLKRSDVLLIFTYAPFGLGHLRVTDALRDGLPEGVNSVLLGSDDARITYWYSLMSVNPFLRRIMEWFGQGNQQRWFSKMYIWVLRHTTHHLYRQMVDLLTRKWTKQKTIVIISTHFGLAHQLAQIKTRLETNLKVKLLLVVQVTDATSIPIWYVAGADLICVPSVKVKQELGGGKDNSITVSPYPLSQKLGVRLNTKDYELRLGQYNPEAADKINVVIPISGAAVGLDYYTDISAKLGMVSDRFRLFVVVRRNIHTRIFIHNMQTKAGVTVIAGDSDKQVVDSYEQLYQDKVIGLEIVKPSEQSFKALFTPQQRGGAILLFTDAVGQQEQDNLNFLLDHKLIPNRALKLTNDPERDAAMINRCINRGIFTQMAGKQTENLKPGDELATNGVQQFWAKVDELVMRENN